MSALRLQTNLLLQAGRLLLEYNESTEAILRALTATARTLTDETCTVSVSYGSVAVSLAREGLALEEVRELRYNMAVQARVHEILEQVRRGKLDASAALACSAQRRSRHATVLALAGQPDPRSGRSQLGDSAWGRYGCRSGGRRGHGTGPTGPAGAWPQTFQPAGATADSRLHRCSPWRAGHPAWLDPVAGTRPGRAGAHGGAGAALH